MGYSPSSRLIILMNLTTNHLHLHFLTCISFPTNMFFMALLFLLEKVKNHHKSLPSSVLIKKLITSFKNINCMLEPNNPIRFLLKRTWVFIYWGATGLDSANSSRTLPSWTLEEGRIPHHMHTDGGNNFKITPSRAWVYLLICLAGSGIWATYFSDWWWAINSTSIIFTLLGMLFLGAWGNLHLSLKSLIGIGKGKDSYIWIFFPSPLDKDVNIAYTLLS